MAKKTRRARRQLTSPSVRPVTPPVVSEEGRSAAVTRSSVAASPAPRKQVDLSAEYFYVAHDLRSMGIIVVAMLVVLIALSFIFR